MNFPKLIFLKFSGSRETKTVHFSASYNRVEKGYEVKIWFLQNWNLQGLGKMSFILKFSELPNFQGILLYAHLSYGRYRGEYFVAGRDEINFGDGDGRSREKYTGAPIFQT